VSLKAVTAADPVAPILSRKSCHGPAAAVDVSDPQGPHDQMRSRGTTGRPPRRRQGRRRSGDVDCRL